MSDSVASVRAVLPSAAPAFARKWPQSCQPIPSNVRGTVRRSEHSFCLECQLSARLVCYLAGLPRN